MYPDSTTPLKRCTKCGRELPATLEYFSKQNCVKSGLYPSCKECKAAAGRRRYAENPEVRQHTLERTAEYQKANPDVTHRKSRKFYETHREEEKARSREYNRANPHVRRVYYERNRERLIEQDRARREKDPERYRKQGREYYETHKPEALHRWRIRRAREKGAEGSHTQADLREIRAGQTDKRGRLRCWYCGEPIEGVPHLDHKIPLSRGGSNGPDNLCYACGPCNISKSSKTPAEYAGRIV